MTTPLVIAHRGASWELPENTLPAFERAGVLHARRLGLATTVYTVDDGDRMRDARLGVTGVCTDCPELARATPRPEP